MKTKVSIRFKNGDLRQLREKLLKDLSKEYFAVLLGKTRFVEENKIITVYEIKYPVLKQYQKQSQAFLKIDKNFIYEIIDEVNKRYDVDTIIDVHTHPFSKEETWFSGVDDEDEINFFNFLNDNFEGINYAGIVFSQNNYKARFLAKDNKKVIFEDAEIYTQTAEENFINLEYDDKLLDKNNFYNRGALALGLDNMRKIMNNQVITLVGVGGIGSIIAEHLLHMGFKHLNLVDFDKLEISNMNRITGAYYSDAVNGEYKVDVIKKHLMNINPEANIKAFKTGISDISIESAIAFSNWIVVATDNHNSRLTAQELSFKYFVPMITAGVNISVENEQITDMSGEVITIRIGDKVCLHCLKRLNHSLIAYETAEDKQVTERLIKNGYVRGKDIKEPAVKTLNSMIATILVNNLINQYTGRQKHQTITVYENNKSMAIYEDYESIKERDKYCGFCDI